MIRLHFPLCRVREWEEEGHEWGRTDYFGSYCNAVR